jgi:hypothetical protein
LILDTPVREVAGHTLAHPAVPCTARDLWPTELDELSPAHREDLDHYLRDFSKPIRNIADEVSCIGCGQQLTARTQRTADELGRTVDVDEKTGEGRCVKCGYPLRALHMMYSRDGLLLVRLVGFPLLYHPHSTKRAN